jgi:16S rRNA (guanine527-N7)-methyltransferase
MPRKKIETAPPLELRDACIVAAQEVIAERGIENLSLREVSRKLALQTRVISARLDEIPPCNAQTITARALAPLTDLLAHASRHLSPAGRAIFPKGRGFQHEIDAALKDWAFFYTSVPSKTDPEAAIIIVKNIEKR